MVVLFLAENIESKQASLFARSINTKDIISMNNVQGQAVRKTHKAQHCWPLCKKRKKNLAKKQLKAVNDVIRFRVSAAAL